MAWNVCPEDNCPTNLGNKDNPNALSSPHITSSNLSLVGFITLGTAQLNHRKVIPRIMYLVAKEELILYTVRELNR